MGKHEYYDRFFLKKIGRRPTISKHILFREVTRHVRKRLAERRGETLALLDVGCGPAHLIARLVGEKRLKLTGIDITDQVLKDISSRMPLARFIQADFSQPTTLPERYDIITAVEIFEHIPRDEKKNFLMNCHRHLKEDGILILTTPNRGRRHMIPASFQNTQPIEDWVTIDELLDLSSGILSPLSIETCVWYFPMHWMDMLFKRFLYPFHMTVEQTMLRPTTLGGHIVFRATPQKGRAA